MKFEIVKDRGRQGQGEFLWEAKSDKQNYLLASAMYKYLDPGKTYEIHILEQGEDDKRYDRYWIDPEQEIVEIEIVSEPTKEGKVPVRKVTKKPVKKKAKKKAKKSDAKQETLEDPEETKISEEDIKAMNETSEEIEPKEQGISLVIPNESQLELNPDNVKKYLSPLATDQEIYMFMQLCINQGLNPFIKDVYLIKYDRSQPASIVVSKDAFLKKAEQIGDYEGFHAGIVVQRKDEDRPVIIERREGSMKLEGETLLGGWAKIYRRDMKVFTAEVSFVEYNTSKSSWRRMPSTMIRKVAIVQALREAFPMSFQGMYDMSEIDVEKK